MTQRMLVAAPPCVLALTLQLKNVLSAGSRLPRSVIVTRSFSFLMVCRTSSGCAAYLRA